MGPPTDDIHNWITQLKAVGHMGAPFLLSKKYPDSFPHKPDQAETPTDKV